MRVVGWMNLASPDRGRSGRVRRGYCPACCLRRRELLLDDPALVVRDLQALLQIGDRVGRVAAEAQGVAEVVERVGVADVGLAPLGAEGRDRALQRRTAPGALPWPMSAKPWLLSATASSDVACARRPGWSRGGGCGWVWAGAGWSGPAPGWSPEPAWPWAWLGLRVLCAASARVLVGAGAAAALVTGPGGDRDGRAGHEGEGGRAAAMPGQRRLAGQAPARAGARARRGGRPARRRRAGRRGRRPGGGDLAVDGRPRGRP